MIDLNGPGSIRMMHVVCLALDGRILETWIEDSIDGDSALAARACLALFWRAAISRPWLDEESTRANKRERHPGLLPRRGARWLSLVLGDRLAVALAGGFA
jgi:hypothetical protein